jgi:predicted O-linked N-acetylglucosamine transferase (SPINDLY family)
VGACYKALGQLEGSAKMFKTAVEIKPDYAEAHKNLGITLRELGQFDEAILSLKKAISINPDYVDAYYNLAIACKDIDKLDNAIQSYQKAVGINPNFAEAYNNLGNVYKDLEQFDHALNSYQKAVGINPNFAEAYNNLGNVYKDLEQFDDAVLSYNKALDANDNLYQASYNLGISLKQLKQFDKAIKMFMNVIDIKPNYAEAYNNLGTCFTMLGQMNTAIHYFEKTLELKPNYAQAHNGLGNVLIILGKVKQAISCFEKATKINPDFAEAYKNLGNAYKKMKKRDTSLIYFEKANKMKSNLDFILGDILNSKMHLCIWDDFQESISDLRNKIVNNEKVIDSFNLLGLIDEPALQRKASIIRINSEFPKNNSSPLVSRYNKHQKIRIGYFSGDFREHPVALLTAGLYETHDRDHFEIHAFSLGPDTNDEMNLRIKAGVDHFHNVQPMSHKEIVELARSLEIDIAVDLAGLTAKSRTDVFAMSAAPIQLSYIGWLGTMGADYYDYLIADPVMIPKENQKYYVEKIVYLPSFQVNDSKDLPPDIVMTRKDAGLPEEGFVFCCFNNTYKFTPTTFDSWARILSEVDNSVLIVYTNNDLSKKNLTKEIVERGIAANRLIFGDSLDRPEYLARYRVADLFLDTQPYNAGTTASDALKMGLPILTLKGQSYQSRMGASILNAVSLPELITNTPEEYESLAIQLGNDPEKMQAIKDKLANNLSSAPLFDTKRFTKNIEAAYNEMYERHHKGLEPEHIYVE